jgi:hypothetical protein
MIIFRHAFLYLFGRSGKGAGSWPKSSLPNDASGIVARLIAIKRWPARWLRSRIRMESGLFFEQATARVERKALNID